MAKQILKTLKKYWLVLVLILVFFLRLPSLFEPFTYADEGIYLTLGQAARRGLVWYRDIHDNKPPMLYLLAALAGNFPTYRLLLFFWSFATIFVFYYFSKALFGKKKEAVIASTTVFAILTSIHTFEGNVANAENFMLLSTIAAFLLLYRFVDQKKAKQPLGQVWFLAGVLFSLATLFKVPAAFDFAAAAVLLLLIFFEKKEKNYPLYAIRYTLLFLGFFFPILITLIYYASKSALNQYLIAAFFQNIPYLSSWTPVQSQTGGLPFLLLSRGLAVFLLVLILFAFRKRFSRTAVLVLVWFAFSWFAALLSSRPYPHYLIQVLPAFSLSFGLLFTKSFKEKTIPLILLAIFIATFSGFGFWHYHSLPYYLNFYQYLFKFKSQEDYFFDFDPRAETIYQLASHLRTHTLPEEKIFIWGTEPSVYALCRRLPVGRYTVAYHIIDFNGFEETVAKLEMEPPRYMILMTYEKRPFPELKAFVRRNYALEKTIGDAKIYRRLFQF